jgi:hypothetical protein
MHIWGGAPLTDAQDGPDLVPWFGMPTAHTITDHTRVLPQAGHLSGNLS